jgi:hypothetical protein
MKRYTDDELRKEYGKSEKLMVSGGITQTHFWREGELSNKEFQQLEREEKKKYINFLLEMNYEDISTIDELNLNQYLPITDIENKKYFNLKEVEQLDHLTASVMSSIFTPKNTTPTLNDEL